MKVRGWEVGRGINDVNYYGLFIIASGDEVHIAYPNGCYVEDNVILTKNIFECLLSPPFQKHKHEQKTHTHTPPHTPPHIP